ncbi:unnamed protein product [Lymnaea stagnalis]|uniref:Uncharacterized protein n=1 Tax=Lymnaea stagnalis TaxID=6523 RepID=A0AAV2IKF1_LYMST
MNIQAIPESKMHIQAIPESKIHIQAIPESKMHIQAIPESKMHIQAADSHYLEPDPCRCGGVQISSSQEAFTDGTCQRLQEDGNQTSDIKAQSMCENTDNISIKTNTGTSAEVQQERNVSHGRWSSSGNKSSGFGDMHFLKEIMDIKIDELNHVTSSIFSPISDQVSQRQKRPDGLILSPLRYKSVLKLHNTKHTQRPQVYTLSKSENVDPLYLHIEKTNLWTQPSLKTKLPWQHNKHILKDDVAANPGRRLVSYRRNGTKRTDPAEPCQLLYRHRDPGEPCQLPYRHRDPGEPCQLPLST